jgi:hypothetical protein
LTQKETKFNYGNRLTKSKKEKQVCKPPDKNA